jgi:L-asparaginase
MANPQRILLIYTGGTIGMVKDATRNTYLPFDFNLIREHFPEFKRFSCEIVVESFNPPLDSSNIGPEVWVRLACMIRDNYDAFNGFVILHGSDTMAYTGSALSFMLEGLSKPVILTGAQLPIGEIRTDARENLVTAMEIASMAEPAIREVAIFFGHKLFRANRTKKVTADVFGAFTSPNFIALAQAGVHLKFFRPTPEDAWNKIPFRVQETLEPRIGLKKFFPGITHSVVDSILLKPEIKGIIIESYGSGNIPNNKELIDSIRKSIEMGKVILNITQCTGGSVEMGRYETSRALKEAGVLDGCDLTFEAALTKMMYLLGKYDDIEKVKYFLEHNIRGEMSSERAYTL